MNEIFPQEIIKEYLEYNSLSTTLECFNAEIKSKSLAPASKKKKKETSVAIPRLYTYCMGEESRSSVNQSLEKRFSQLQKSHEMLMQSAQKIFEIAVSAVSLLEESKIQEETVSSFKLQLSKLQHDLGIKAIKSKESAILNPAYIQSQRNQIVHFLEVKDYHQLTKTLMKVRVDCLNVKQKSRHQLVVSLSENDLMGGSVNLLLTCKNYSVLCSSMALISILCSIETGKKYVLGGNAGYICTLIINILKKEEKNSVCSRFCFAALEKLSLHDAAAAALIESTLIEYIVDKLEHDMHPFIQNFSTALLFNLFSVPAGKAHISSTHEQSNKTLHKLVSFCKEEKDLQVIYHCFLSMNIILKIYPNLLPSKDITRIVEHVRASTEKDEYLKSRIFDLGAKLLNRLTDKINKVKKEKPQVQEEEIYFECFTDEAPLINHS